MNVKKILPLAVVLGVRRVLVVVGPGRRREHRGSTGLPGLLYRATTATVSVSLSVPCVPRRLRRYYIRRRAPFTPCAPATCSLHRAYVQPAPAYPQPSRLRTACAGLCANRPPRRRVYRAPGRGPIVRLPVVERLA